MADTGSILEKSQKKTQRPLIGAPAKRFMSLASRSIIDGVAGNALGADRAVAAAIWAGTSTVVGKGTKALSTPPVTVPVCTYGTATVFQPPRSQLWPTDCRCAKSPLDIQRSRMIAHRPAPAGKARV
jgi:hypothetical protein